MLIRADLHNHFRTGSNWKEGDFNRAVDAAGARLGEGGIVALVNFNDSRYENFLGLKGYERDQSDNAIYVPEKQILIVKGQEVQTTEGHLLVLGLKRGKQLRTGRGISLDYAMKEADDNGGIKIADHPFYREGIGKTLLEKPELVKMLDAIEVHNGEAAWLPGLTPRNANKEARARVMKFKALNPNLGFLSSSDGHSFYEIGRTYTELNFVPEDNFTESLRKSVRSASVKYAKTINPLGGCVGALDHIADLFVITHLKKS